MAAVFNDNPTTLMRAKDVVAAFAVISVGRIWRLKTSEILPFSLLLFPSHTDTSSGPYVTGSILIFLSVWHWALSLLLF